MNTYNDIFAPTNMASEKLDLGVEAFKNFDPERALTKGQCAELKEIMQEIKDSVEKIEKQIGEYEPFAREQRLYEIAH